MFVVDVQFARAVMMWQTMTSANKQNARDVTSDNGQPITAYDRHVRYDKIKYLYVDYCWDD